MTLLLFYRYLGVLVAVCGAFLTSPDGTRRLLTGLWDDVLSARRWVARHLPWRRRGQEGVLRVGPPPTFTMRAVAPTFTTGDWGWSPDAPVDERVDWLYRQVARIDGLVSTIREQTYEEIRRVRDECLSITDTHRAMLEQIRTEHDRHRETSVRIDAASLPLIGLGIVLTGMPDQAMRWWWIWPVMLIALWAIARSGRRYLSERATVRTAAES